ncbi:hypothetical protein ACG94V_08955 [Acinetobacter sp. ULE_I001]|uniref:hypothetical protein n=1 Tax=unclassified Acinetobacter TaxID=196816 RepID=UPI0030185C4E
MKNKYLFLFVIFICIGFFILLVKGELQLSQSGGIEKECIGVNIPESVKYTKSRQYCTCFNNQLNYKDSSSAQSFCLNKIN